MPYFEVSQHSRQDNLYEIVFWYFQTVEKQWNASLDWFGHLLIQLLAVWCVRIEAWTKWPTFCRRLWNTFLTKTYEFLQQLKWSFFPKFPIDTKWTMLQVMHWRRIHWKPASVWHTIKGLHLILILWHTQVFLKGVLLCFFSGFAFLYTGRYAAFDYHWKKVWYPHRRTSIDWGMLNQGKVSVLNFLMAVSINQMILEQQQIHGLAMVIFRSGCVGNESCIYYMSWIIQVVRALLCLGDDRFH